MVRVREKVPGDREELLALLDDVRRTDGYPRYLRGDPARFLTPPYERAAWVAERDGRIIGHVALHDAALDPTFPVAHRATGLPADGLAVLARLLVSPDARRQGVAGRLTAVARRHARARGRRVVLDVVRDAAGPVALYEALGWRRLEALRLDLGGAVLELWVYLEPEAAPEPAIGAGPEPEPASESGPEPEPAGDVRGASVS